MKRKILTALTIGLTVLSATPVFAGQWKQNAKGYWYQNDDGSYPASAWRSIDGKWYYFKPDGYMNTGWIKVNGQWYYCEQSGEMRTADLPTDVMTFKFNADGSCSNFYANSINNTQVVYYHDISGTNTPTVDRFSLADAKFDIPHHKNNESLTGLTTDEVD